jgi:cell division protein FtsB
MSRFAHRLRLTLVACLALAVSLALAASSARAQTSPDAEPTASGAGTDSGAAAVQTPSGDAQAQAQLEELQRRVDILAAEVEQLRSGEPESTELTEARRRALGLAPSAAATYRRRTEGVSIAGYGEMLLENFDGEDQAGSANAPTTRLDFLRAIVYAGYRFDERFLFNSEIEVEHAGEIFIEFAYLDYLVNDHFSVRGGLLLVPLGLVNEFHEPTVFLGSKRPETESRILPSTWRENGAGLLGSFGRVSFRAYVVNGLAASGFTSAGLRGGRQKGIQARAAHMAFAGRLDVTPVPGIFVGGGLYQGGSGQGAIVADGEPLDIENTIGEVHGQAQLRGFDVRGLYARARVGDAGRLSGALRLPVTAPVAERLEGGYLQMGYDVLSQRGSAISLMPYVRIEQVDTQARVPAGYSRDLSRDGTFRTLGLEVKPIPQVVLKTEYQWVRNAAGTGRNQFNVNLGYAF